METVVVGEIAGVYGIKGWLRLKSWTQPLDQIFNYQPWFLTQGDNTEKRNCKLLDYRQHNGQYVICLDGISDRDAAARLIRHRIEVDKDCLPELPDNEYYWAELLGMQVVNTAGEAFGQVINLLETGANDVLVINGDRQRLVPFVQGQVVTSVDRTAKRITVDWDAEF